MNKHRKRSLILLFLRFLISLAVILWVARVSLSTPIVQTQNNSLQLIEEAQQQYQEKKFSEAAIIWQQTADIFATKGDKLNQGMALSNLSLTYQQLGQWDEARKTINKSIFLLKHLKKNPVQQRILAASLDIKGQLQLSLGEAANALNTWQEGTKIYQNIGNQKKVIQSQLNQAQAMQQLGFYPRACQRLIETLDIKKINCEISENDLETLSEKISIAQKILGLQSLGNVLRVTGQTQQSQLVLLKSLQLAQTNKEFETLAEIFLSIGNTARVLGNQMITREKQKLSINSLESITCIPDQKYQTSNEFYQQAMACYQEAASGTLSMTKIQAQLNLLNLFIQREQWNQIPNLITTVKSELIDDFNNKKISLPPSQKNVVAQLKLAQNLMCLQTIFNPNDHQFVTPILQSCPTLKKKINFNELQSFSIPAWTTINQLIETALNQAQNIGDKQGEANAFGYLGATHEALGNLPLGQQLTEAALQRLSAFDNPELTYFWQWQLGRFYRLEGQNKKAIASYTLAVDILESLREDLVVTNADIQFNFRDSVEPVYRELVDQLLQPSDTGKISQENLRKARNIIESLQLVELNNFFREACIDAEPQQIDQLDPDAAVIYSIVLPQHLAVILSLPAQPLSYHETPLNNGPEEVETIFEDLFANLNPYISSPDPLIPHQQLYDWLIRPLERELNQNQIKTLVFVNDGVLRGVPMAALHDGQQYLIQKYNVALTPGLQLLSPRSLSSDQLTTLAGGLAQSRQGFSALPGVKEEVQEIAQIVSTEVFLDEQFTSDRLQKAIESTSFPIVHLATHGQFSSQVEETFLLTWDERINVKNLDQFLQEREGQQRSPIELLILSACQTATGDKRAVLGLAGVAVRSGARSTLATLWSVQDESTAHLIAQFYKSLSRPGVTKAEALRQAQLSLLQSTEYQHPFYWAPFVLVGNWL